MYSKKIEQKETEAFKDLAIILQNKGFKGVAEPTPYGTHWDVTITTPNGKQQYIELKRRTCTIDRYPDATALNVAKAGWLKKIQDETGIEVVWVQEYPLSGQYIAMSLDDIFQKGWIATSTKKEVEMDENSQKIKVDEWHVALDPMYIFQY